MLKNSIFHLHSERSLDGILVNILLFFQYIHTESGGYLGIKTNGNVLSAVCRILSNRLKHDIRWSRLCEHHPLNTKIQKKEHTTKSPLLFGVDARQIHAITTRDYISFFTFPNSFSSSFFLLSLFFAVFFLVNASNLASITANSSDM